MSAWLVSKRHIDLIVSASIAFKAIKSSAADVIGDMLYQENAKSLRYRYGDAEEFWEFPKPNSYHYEPLVSEDPDYIFKQLSCYNYQACEHPEWETSNSCALVAKLREQIALSVGTDCDGMFKRPGFETAPWGVD